MSTATSDAPITIQQAFTEATTEHSASAERATSGEASPDGSPSPSPDETPAASPATTTADSTTSSSDLISDAELSALQQTHAGNPDALDKALKANYTRKTQALAEERKAIADVAAHADTLRAYRNDPEGFIRSEAQRLGLQIGQGTIQEAKTAQTAQHVATDVIAEFKADLGPDLEFLADSLAPAVQKATERAAKRAVEEATAPLKSAQDALTSKAAAEQVASTLQAFEAKHPDWKQHEPAMLKIAGELKPNGMEDAKYLDTLYKLATFDVQIAEGVKATTARMTQGAKTAEPRTDGMAESRVDTSARKVSSIREAFAEAKAEAARR